MDLKTDKTGENVRESRIENDIKKEKTLTNDLPLEESPFISCIKEVQRSWVVSRTATLPRIIHKHFLTISLRDTLFFDLL